MMMILENFESSDLSNAPVSEGVSEDGEGPVERFPEVAARGLGSGVGACEGLDELPGGGAERAIGVDGEWSEAHTGVSVDVVLVLLALAFFSDVDCVIATGTGASDDCAVDGETAWEFGMGGDPDVGRPGLGDVEDGTGVGVGGEASGTSDGGDGRGESVVAALGPASGLSADESVFAEGIDDPYGPGKRRRSLPGRESCGATARAATGGSNAGVGAQEGKTIAAADRDGGVARREGGGSSAIRGRELDPRAP